MSSVKIFTIVTAFILSLFQGHDIVRDYSLSHENYYTGLHPDDAEPPRIMDDIEPEFCYQTKHGTLVFRDTYETECPSQEEVEWEIDTFLNKFEDRVPEDFMYGFPLTFTSRVMSCCMGFECPKGSYMALAVGCTVLEYRGEITASWVWLDGKAKAWEGWGATLRHELGHVLVRHLYPHYRGDDHVDYPEYFSPVPVLPK